MSDSSDDPIQIPRYDNFKSASESASKAKRANRNRDTKPELLLRKALWRRGLRYRKNVKDLPGKPDVVFRGLKIAVFCDGDFWHGRDWDALEEKLQRGSNSGYWLPKISRNVQRDQEHNQKLEAEGWIVLRYWESDVRKDLERIADEIVQVVESRRKQ